ncbi:MAG TPA: hypothetical protein DCY79_10360 [Planctomycetaceae bacterium]|nr:hypothetical protein [Blastopirellula sp.]HAY80195.1 hypothetical protein [Planctomycetaceae bacterium]|tara:strand:+ start:466 stop:2562 length:2097 start_codon:yes stop_codon:yes gene_type:complete
MTGSPYNSVANAAGGKPAFVSTPSISASKLACSLLVVLWSTPVVAADPISFDSTVKPFLNQYCAECHSGASPEGDISLKSLTGNLSREGELQRWEKIYHQLTLATMPPPAEAQPNRNTRVMVVRWLEQLFANAGMPIENKLSRPGYGNYLPHASLFGDAPVQPSFSPPRLWRIRPAVYANRLQQVAKGGNYVKPFTLKSGGHTFRDYDNQYVIAGADLAQLMANTKVAADLLTQTIDDKGQRKRGPRTPEQLFQLLDPDNASPSDEQFTTAVDWLYHHVLLRDPTDEEAQRTIAFARQSMSADGRELGVRNLVSAVLLHPECLYRSEQGTSQVDELGRVMLLPRELAFAIAYSLTDRRPDETLLQAADEGHLTDRKQVQTQVERILTDDTIDKPRILGFFREYFEYGGAVDVFKDLALNRNHAPEILVSDTDHLIMHIYRQDKDVLRELLTTNKSFVQFGMDSKTKQPVKASAKNLGAHFAYNLPPDWKWIPDQPIALPNAQRAGILTQPAWLVAKSGNFDNDAIRRGLWVRAKLLGGSVPDVPITVDAQLPNDETLTLREKMAVTEEAYCWKCHQNTNPVGLPFEMFDHFGRWRTQELGKPVVTTGAINNSHAEGLDGNVPDAIAMVRKLADSPRVRQVFVRHAFRYYMGRNETIHDAATLRRADQDYVNSGGSMKALIASLLTSDSFLYRKPIQGK